MIEFSYYKIQIKAQHLVVQRQRKADYPNQFFLASRHIICCGVIYLFVLIFRKFDNPFRVRSKKIYIKLDKKNMIRQKKENTSIIIAFGTLWLEENFNDESAIAD